MSHPPTLLRALRAPLIATVVNFGLSTLLVTPDMGFLVILVFEILRLAIIAWAGWLVVRHGFGNAWRAASTSLMFVVLDLIVLRGGLLLLVTPGSLASSLGSETASGYLTAVILTSPVAMLFGAFGGLLAAVQAESRARRGEGDDDPEPEAWAG